MDIDSPTGVRRIAAGTLALVIAVFWTGGDRVVGQSAQTTASKPTFKSGVDLVRITAVVQDRRGRPVLGLLPSDFELNVGGERVQIIEFGSEASGVSVALLVDDSGSMSLAGRRGAAQEVAKHILSWLEAGRDEVTLLGFDKSLRTVQPFTTQPSVVAARLGELQPYGLTSLYDAIAAAARPLVTRNRPRRAVVVITDGVDTASVMSPPEVSRIASEIDVPVYVVAIRVGVDRIGGLLDAGSVIDASSQASLEDLARWTGGATFTAGTPAETSLVAQRILAELRHQYLIAFEASPRAGWHSLTVGVRKKNVLVRARGGYMAGTNAGSL
jgi:Ca-activated chloride channel family protein